MQLAAPIVLFLLDVYCRLETLPFRKIPFGILMYLCILRIVCTFLSSPYSLRFEFVLVSHCKNITFLALEKRTTFHRASYFEMETLEYLVQ